MAFRFHDPNERNISVLIEEVTTVKSESDEMNNVSKQQGLPSAGTIQPPNNKADIRRKESEKKKLKVGKSQSASAGQHK